MEFEVLKNIFKENELEKLLIANWTKFLDSSKLMAFVLKKITENKNKFAIITDNDIRPKGMSITLSRCCWIDQGFNIWLEFTVPLSHFEMTEGTMELLLSNNGNIIYITTLGNIYSKK